jgi:type I restriction enzyme S subunit
VTNRQSPAASSREPSALRACQDLALLGPDESPDEIRVRLVDERNTRRREEGIRTKGANRNTPPAITDLQILPRGWAWTTFEVCSWDLTVGHVGPMKSRYVLKGIPFLRSFNVRPKRVDADHIAYIDETFDKELQKSKLSAGTIVVVRTGAPGVAAVVPEELDGANCSDLVICRPIASLDAHYAAHYINSDFAQNLVRKHQVGVAQQHFNVGAMSSLAVPFAPVDERAEIVRRVRNAFERIDMLQDEAGQGRNLLDRLDQATLAKAFRGELLQAASSARTSSL